MKRIFIPIALAAVALLIGGCQRNSNTYANQLKEEKKIIEQYIQRENIKIIYEEPDRDEWKDNEYLELKDYCYFHLTQSGDTTTDAVTVYDNINLRYRQYTLTQNADTTSYWNTNESAYPSEYTLSTLYSTCEGMYLAIMVMKYTGSEGKLICPSKLGANASLVIPYGYDLKMQIRRF